LKEVISRRRKKMANFSPLVYMPPETLCSILEYVSGKDLTRLHIAGNKNLNNSILERGGATSFFQKFTQPHQICVPPLVYMLRHLRHLKLSIKYPLRHSHTIKLDPEWLPRSLRSIDCPFLDHKALIVDAQPSQGPDIRHLLPNLEVMTTPRHHIWLRREATTLLPSLMVLHLHCVNDNVLSVIPLVPRTVTELSLEGHVFRDDFVDDASAADPQFPPHLVNLIIQSSPAPDYLMYLPPTLKKLIVSFSGIRGLPTLEHLKHLPQGLKHFSWSCNRSGQKEWEAITVTAELAAALPRGLENLNLWGSEAPTSTSELSDTLYALPRGLMAFHGIGLPQRDVDWDHIRESAQCAFAELRKLSGHVTSFMQKVGWFPPKATSIDSVSGKCVLPLPKTLTSLSYSPSFEDFAPIPGRCRQMHLPDSLKQLTRCFNIHQLDLERLKSLSFLTGVVLEIGPSKLVFLPPGLKTLHWSYAKPSEQTDTNFTLQHLQQLKKLIILRMATSQFPPLHPLWSNLPQSLDSLSLDLHSDDPIDADVLLQITHERLPRLRSLSITPIQGFQDHHLRSLPRSLISLSIHGDQSNSATGECLAPLTRNLVFLKLPKLSFDAASPPKLDHLPFLDESSASGLSRPTITSWTFDPNAFKFAPLQSTTSQ
jgi:hypothetical protein